MTDLWRHKKTYGFDNTDDIEPIAKSVKEILEGKKYMFITCYEHLSYEPDIRLNQKMRNIKTWMDDNGRYGGFHISDDYGVWGCLFLNKETKEDDGYISLFENGIVVHRKNDFGQWYWWKLIVQDGRFHE